MIAFHGEPGLFIQEAIRRGYVTVNADSGIAYCSRRGGRPLGCISSRGYIVCTLHIDGIRKQVKLHQIVWISVNGPVPVGHQIDHVNRDKTDNRIANLRAVPPVVNAGNRRSLDGAANPSARLTHASVIAIRKSRQSYSDIARDFGVSKSTIASIMRGDTWKS